MIFRRTFCRAFITLLGQLKSALQNDDPSYIACVRIVISGEDLVFPITAITRDHGDSSVSPRLRGRCCLSDHARLRAIPRDLSRLPRRSRGALPWITGDLHPSAYSAYSVFQRCWGWFLNFGNSGDYGNFGNSPVSAPPW